MKIILFLLPIFFVFIFSLDGTEKESKVNRVKKVDSVKYKSGKNSVPEKKKNAEKQEPDQNKQIKKTPVPQEKTDPDVYAIDKNVAVDSKNGFLMWQRSSGKDLTWENAKSYCSNLSLDGHSDWRMPTISELKTLIAGCQSGTDACKVSDSCYSSSCWSNDCSCKINEGPGENGFYWYRGVWEADGQDNFFWSSSEQSDIAGNRWGILFGSGYVYYSYEYYKRYVRCVR